MKLEDLRINNLAVEIGEDIWKLCNCRDTFEKNTIGYQLVRSVDTIAANISEGFGRFHYKEVRNFCFIARGSLFETKTWVTKSFNRKLIDQDTFNQLKDKINLLGKMFNKYIQTIGPTDNILKEDQIPCQ